MKIACYRVTESSTTVQVGAVSADGTSVQAWAFAPEEAARGALAVIEALDRGQTLPALLAPRPLSQVQLLAPLPRPRRNLFCVGKNYHAHAREFAGSGFDSSAKAGGDIPSVPIVFTKVPESVVGPGAAVLVPAGVSTSIDYEVELTVIIGKGGKGIKAADAMAHVWGYTCLLYTSPSSPDARICSFECTFCADCTDQKLMGRCPNCGGELVRRPVRPEGKLARFPASGQRIFKPQGSAAVNPP